MRKATTTFLVVMAIMLGSCASKIAQIKLNPDQQSALDKAMAFPLEFEIDKSDVNDAWGRAQSFISKYSTMKLQTVTDYVIDTYNPTDAVSFAYAVTKTPLKNKVQISVQCKIYWDSWPAHKVDAERNAHLLAYYVATGELFVPELVAQ